MKRPKRVTVIAYAFDCLPGHIHIRAAGAGRNFSAAVRDALKTVFADAQLKYKHIHECKLQVVAVREERR